VPSSMANPVVGVYGKIPAQATSDLHEHDRSNVPHMRSGEFISHVELFFRRPDELVLGRETATEALGRFENAIDDIVAHHDEGNLAIENFMRGARAEEKANK